MKPAAPRFPPLWAALQLSLELEKNNVPPNVARATLNEFLAEPIEAWCSCGKQLVYYQAQGKLCQECREAYLEALERKKKQGGIEDPTEARMFKLGVPPRYRHCTLANWRGAISDALADWINRPNRDVVIWGPGTGTGKTHLATATLYSVASGNRLSCHWFTAVDLARHLSDEQFNPAHPTLLKFSRVGVPLLDDYGSETKVLPGASELVHEALRRRHNDNRPTIVTTNLTPEQMLDREPRIASRLLSGLVLEEFSGPDQRMI